MYVLLYGNMLLWRNGFYNSLFCYRFLWPAYPSLPLISGHGHMQQSCLGLLLVLVQQQQYNFAYCWFMCGNNNTTFLTIGSCVAAASQLDPSHAWVQEMLEWDEEYVERSKNGKRWIRYNMVMIDNEKLCLKMENDEGIECTMLSGFHVYYLSSQ